MSRTRRRYFVKCARCDQTSWLERADAPLPSHGIWDRRQEPSPTLPAPATDRDGAVTISPGQGQELLPHAPDHSVCPGSDQPGLWLGEDLDGGPIIPPPTTPPESPTGTSPVR